MYEIFLFLLIFFGIFGAFKVMHLMYTFAVKRIIEVICKKEEDVKIWVKS